MTYSGPSPVGLYWCVITTRYNRLGYFGVQFHGNASDHPRMFCCKGGRPKSLLDKCGRKCGQIWQTSNEDKRSKREQASIIYLNRTEQNRTEKNLFTFHRCFLVQGYGTSHSMNKRQHNTIQYEKRCLYSCKSIA